MGIKLTVNGRQFSQEMRKSLAKKNSVRVLEQNLKMQNGENLVKKIEEMKKDMIKSFLGLGVTREILGGKNASNISGTLGGYGNLFSFIGFPEGSSPVDPIVELLQQPLFHGPRELVGRKG